MIVEKFGGLITCLSKWGEGTSFIFLFALDENVDAQEQDFGCRNPIHKVYPKIIID
jgi:hypothetical protein